VNYIKVLFDLYRLKQNTKMSAGQMKQLQDRKLKELLRFAWEKSKYYRNAFNNAGITEEQLDTLPLSAFPTIDQKALAVEGFCIKGLRDYQFRKIDRAAFEILAEVPNEARWETVRMEIQKQMEKILTEKKLFYVQFYIRFVKEILPDPATGKKLLILAECPVYGKEAVV